MIAAPISSIRASLLRSAGLLAFLLTACTSTKPPQAPTTPPTAQAKPSVPVEPAKPAEVMRPSSFGAVPGWERDELTEAWPAFMASCQALVRKADWKEPCTIARDISPADARQMRVFFETFFTPNQVINPDGNEEGLATGYYEPLLRGARKRGGNYQTALYATPDDLLTVDLSGLYPELKNMRLRGRLVGNKVVPYWPRAQLDQSGVLNNKVLVWVDDPVEAFFLQVQGSGRVQLTDTGETVRVAYADQNGHPYKSIGRYLVDKGELRMEQASMQGIKNWVATNPGRQQELLNANPSFVFFKEEKLPDPSIGPKGALGVALTPRRSIAVDAQYIPLGAPVFLATTQPNSDVPMQRLVMAQDTGGAIRNPVRADFFWGFGHEAGEQAGRMKQRARMWVLLPKKY